MVQKVFNLNQVNARARQIDLMFIPDKLATNFIGDPVRVEQILMNLVSNAIKFTKVGNVQLGGDHYNTEEIQKIRLSVNDTGIGLTQEQIENLFKPFTQADASTTRQFGGTGLGLSITKQLVTQLQGTIS